MNPRIKLIDENTVEVQRNEESACTTVLFAEDRNIIQESNDLDIAWDAEGRAALRDVLNCFDATGSFAALSDESADKWQGKRLLIKSAGIECTYLAPDSDGTHAVLCEDDIRLPPESDLGPPHRRSQRSGRTLRRKRLNISAGKSKKCTP